MVESMLERRARSYIAGAVTLLEGYQDPFGGFTKGEELDAAAALLELARSTLDGKAVARELKNANDRERRAKAKTKTKTRPRPKRRGTPGAELRPDLVK